MTESERFRIIMEKLPQERQAQYTMRMFQMIENQWGQDAEGMAALLDDDSRWEDADE